MACIGRTGCLILQRICKKVAMQLVDAGLLELDAEAVAC
jgi:hypothetical protein